MEPSDQASSTDTVTGNTESVGDVLREAREALDEDIRNAARVLRINWRYIEALEQDRFKDLPGNVYVIGFIRSYAEHLGLDGADLVVRYKEASEADAKKTQLDFPEPIPETGLPGGAILFAGLVVAVLAYGGWYLATEDDSTVASLVKPVPERLAEDAGAETKDAQSDVTDAGAGGANPVSDAIDQNLAAVQSVVEEADAEGAEVSEADVVIEETPEEASVEAMGETADETSEMVQETEGAAQIEEIETSTTSSAENVAEEMTPPEVSDSAIGEEVVSGTVEESISSVDEAETEQVAEDSADTQALNEAQLRAVQESMGTVVENDVSDENAEGFGTETEEVASITDGEETSVNATALSSDSNTESSISEASVIEDDEPRVYGEEGDVRIVIVATANSWTEVRDTNSGELLLTRLLKTGDSFRVPDREGIVLVTGNAGGLEITVDGTVTPAIGGSGQIRRDIALEPDLLLTGDAAN